MKNRKNIIIVICIVIFVVLVIGASYGFFVYNKDIANVSSGPAEISIDYSNVTNTLNVPLIPRNDYEGKNMPGYIDFTVTSKADVKEILYELTVSPQNNANVDSSHVKVYLTDQQDNEILSPFYYNELYNSTNDNGKVFYQNLIKGNNDGTNKTTTEYFRLRMWIDEEYSDKTTKSFVYSINLHAINVNKDDYLKLRFDTDDARTHGVVKYVKIGETYGSLPTLNNRIDSTSESEFKGWGVTSSDTVAFNNSDYYEHPEEYTFNGTSDYIDTGVYLFNNDNWQKNFYISVDIVSNTSTANHASIIGLLDDVPSDSTGIMFGRYQTNSKYRVVARKSTSVNYSITTISYTTQKVEFLKVNNILYYRLDEGEWVQTIDFSNFYMSFNYSLLFGADWNTSSPGTVRYLYTGVLSNMLVRFISDDATLQNFDQYLVREERELKAKWNKIKYEYKDEYEFDGTSDFIDTELYLFNSENWEKNFYISFDILSNSSSTAYATILRAAEKEVTGMLGMYFRKYNTNSAFTLNVRKDSSTVSTTHTIAYTSEKIELLRLNNIIYYRVDGGALTQTIDFTGFTGQFDLPTIFGASIDGATNIGDLFKFFNGKLANIVVKFISDEATTSNFEDYIGEESTSTVTFNAAGGKSSVNSKVVTTGQKYGILPTPSKDGYVFKGWSTHALPYEYQEVEYIKSSGTQYIATSIIPTDTMGLYAKVKSTDITSNVVFVGTTTPRFYIANQSSKFYFGWGDTYTASASRPAITTTTINEIYLNYKNSRICKFNDTVVVPNPLTTLAETTYPIYIFAQNNSGALGYYSKIELYELRFTDGSNIIADFVPCYRKSDNEVGLYDLVSKQFYSDAASSATLLAKGNDVNTIVNGNTIVTAENDHTLYAMWESE